MKRIVSTTINLSAAHVCLLLLRVGSALIILTHGFPKFSKIIAGNFAFADPLGLGSATSLVLSTFAEFGCAILLLLGAATRLAAIPLIINMMVIAFVAHANDTFGKKNYPYCYFWFI
jgi:putative oxidoreductase